MRKLAHIILFCSLTPAFCPLPRAESLTIEEEAAKYGYSRELLNELPKSSQAPKRVSPQPVQTTTPGGFIESTGPSSDLNPRVYQAPEPSAMIPMLIRLHQKDPQSAKITRKLALTCLEADQPQEALHWFSMTWQRDRGDLAALWNLAALSWRLGDRQAARAFLEEYAKLDPYSPWGKTARQMNQYEFLTDSGGNFDGHFPRTGVSLPGGTASGGSLLVIDGRTTLPDDYSTPNRFPVDNPLKPRRKDDVEPADKSGRKQTADRKDPSLPAAGAAKDGASKPSLQKAVIDSIPSPGAASPTTSTPPASPASGPATPPPQPGK